MPFAGDFTSVRLFLDRDHENVVSWHGYTVGGHHVAHQAPDVLAGDEWFRCPWFRYARVRARTTGGGRGIARPHVSGRHAAGTGC